MDEYCGERMKAFHAEKIGKVFSKFAIGASRIRHGDDQAGKMGFNIMSSSKGPI